MSILKNSGQTYHRMTERKAFRRTTHAAKCVAGPRFTARLMVHLGYADGLICGTFGTPRNASRICSEA
jgi:phosphotransacetylase